MLCVCGKRHSTFPEKCKERAVNSHMFCHDRHLPGCCLSQFYAFVEDLKARLRNRALAVRNAGAVTRHGNVTR